MQEAIKREKRIRIQYKVSIIIQLLVLFVFVTNLYEVSSELFRSLLVLFLIVSSIFSTILFNRELKKIEVEKRNFLLKKQAEDAINFVRVGINFLSLIAEKEILKERNKL